MIKEKEEVTEVTKDEFVKVIVYMITQIQLEPNNMEHIANSIGYSFSRLFKKKFWIFQYELICLFVALATIATKEHLTDQPNLLKKIVDEVYLLLYEICFPSSTDPFHKLEWWSHTKEKSNKYIDKCQPWNSNSMSLMADMFIENLPKLRNKLSARVYLSTYIQSSYFSLQEALDSYKIINAEHEEILAKNEYDDLDE